MEIEEHLWNDVTFKASDPEAQDTIRILGSGETFEGVTFTRDQIRALEKLYKFNNTISNYNDNLRAVKVDRFEQAGSSRNLFRYTRSDGFRVMAILAKYLEPGEDPVKFIVRLLSSQGYDIGTLIEWADENINEENNL